MKTYTVTANLTHPGSYHRGYEIEIQAKNKAEAIKIARRKVWDLGHTRQDGGLRYTAQEAGA
jgi:hypothetical protein